MSTGYSIEPKYQKRIAELCNNVNWNYNDIFLIKEPIGGTNTTFFVSYHDELFVLRIATDTIDLLQIDRNAEAEVMRIASNDGIGLKLYYFDENNGDMITYYEDGHVPTMDELKKQSNIDKLIEQFKKLHGHHVAHFFMPTVDIEKRINRISLDKQLNKRKNYTIALSLFRSIQCKFNSFDQRFVGLCHNDASNYNMLLGEEIKLLDFEFAGMGNIFYDLACVCGLWGIDDQIMFLQKYFGCVDRNYLHIIKDYTILELIWNGTWAYIKYTDNNLIDIDYLGWADEQFGLAIDLLHHNSV